MDFSFLKDLPVSVGSIAIMAWFGTKVIDLLTKTVNEALNEIKENMQANTETNKELSIAIGKLSDRLDDLTLQK